MTHSTIITGQFVRISQVPASIGERLLARIIDFIIIFLYAILSFYTLRASGLLTRPDTFVILFLLMVYLPVLCYTLLWELFNRGQSPGKMVLKIRVIKLDGSAPTLGSYLLRWLLFVIDGPITSGLGIIFIIISKNNQRLGDLAAGTMVIKEKNYRNIQVSLDEFDYLTDNYRPVFPQAADLSLEQVNVIARTLAMKTADRSKLIRQLADKTRSMLSVSRESADDEALLNTLVRDYQYYALETI